MSPQFNFQENELEEADVITLWDEQGRSLDCYIENAYETDDLTYMLLVPVDTPVMILAWDEESEEEESDAFLIEDSEEIERVFADAKAVLAELDLLLKPTAHTLTAPSSSSEPEELQFLASFFSEDQKYSIYSPLAPLLFLAVGDAEGKVELVSPDDDGMGPILEELLFDELD